MGNVNFFATILISLVGCAALGQMESVPLRKIFSTLFGTAIGFYFYGILYVTNIVYITVPYIMLQNCSRTTASNFVAWWGAIIMVSISYYSFHIAD